MEYDDAVSEVDFLHSYVRVLRPLNSIDSLNVREMINKDTRFLICDIPNLSNKFFISKEAIYEWLWSLNFKLSRLKILKLSKPQISDFSKQIFTDRLINEIPKNVVKFGNQYGLICYDFKKDTYIFPYAKILSHFKGNVFLLAVKILKDLKSEHFNIPNFNNTIYSLIEEGFGNFKPKTVKVIKKRNGLGYSKKTLREIGKEIDLSPEGVRKIEMKFQEILFSKDKKYISPFLKTFLLYILNKKGSMIEDVNISMIDYIIFLFNSFEIPLAKIDNINTVIFTNDINKIESFLCKEKNMNLDIYEITSNLSKIYGLNLNFNDLFKIAKKIHEYRGKKLNSKQRVYLTLKRIGEPAHYSLITELHNQLFSDYQSNENSIHTYLNYARKLGVVWIGMRGTFALEEWGDKQAEKSLLDIIYEIVEQKHKETGKPVSYNVIQAEIGKYRKLINPNSFSMSVYLNPKIKKVDKNSFIPKDKVKDEEDSNKGNHLNEILKDFINENSGSYFEADDLKEDEGILIKEQQQPNFNKKEKDKPIKNNNISIKYICPNCGSPMIFKKGDLNDFYLCSTFPECRKSIVASLIDEVIKKYK